jgi:short-subunit dehydrogenase
MAEEQVIDDYYVSLQKGEIDSRARIGDLSKEELLDKLKENLNADLDQIAAQINSSGKDKWRNSTVKSTAQQSKLNVNGFYHYLLY